MTNRILLIIIISITVTNEVLGQLMVRESFAAATQAAKPASFLWTVEKSPADIGFGTIDAGIRYAFEWNNFIAGPTIEWHKLTREDKEYDRYSIGGSGELLLPIINIPWLGNPYATGQLSYERNRLTKEEGLGWSISSTFFSRSTAAPGSQNQLWTNSMIRYYPHFGIERHPAVSESITNATLSFLQLNIEFWPWIGRVQGLTSYTIVRKIKGEGLPNNLNRLSLSINYYLDSNERIGIGVEYSDFTSPKDGFKKIRRTIMGFKVKI